MPLVGKIGVKTRSGAAVVETTVNLPTAYQDFMLDFTSTSFPYDYVYFTINSPGGSVTVKLDDWALTRLYSLFSVCRMKGPLVFLPGALFLCGR